jgi:hypothetical protein
VVGWFADAGFGISVSDRDLLTTPTSRSLTVFTAARVAMGSPQILGMVDVTRLFANFHLDLSSAMVSPSSSLNGVDPLDGAVMWPGPRGAVAETPADNHIRD